MMSPLTRMALPVLLASLVLGCQQVHDSTHGKDGPAGLTPVSAVFDGTAGTWIDLTHAFSEESIYWPTDTLGFRHEQLSFGPTPGGWFYASYRYSAAEHGGTHLDAPIHFAEGRHTSDEIPLGNLMGPAVVVDVSAKADADYQAGVADLEAWEAEHGRIPDGAILLLRTGWGARYGDRTAYLGTDLTGPEAVPQLHFPGLDPAAAQWLVDERDIAAFGLDTPSLDRGQSKDFRTHVILNSENIPGLENIANLDRLPPAGAYAVALPMKIENGSGGPLRIVAFVPGKTE